MTTTGMSLRLEDITMHYGKTLALEPTTLDVKAGEFLTLLGPSGSGKTTLLNLIAGYLTPTSGNICIGDKNVTRLPARMRNIGMVFQNYALFPHMTVSENIGYGLSVRGLAKDESERRVSDILNLMQLDQFADRAIQNMSGGQQQRVALARALVIEPDVLLMDEPLSALDRQLRQAVQLELRRLHRKHARTTIYVTHDQEEALVLSDRIAVMDQGRIQQLGSVDDIYNRPANAFVAGFIGESNLIPVKVLSVSEGQATVHVEAFNKNITVDAGQSVAPGKSSKLLLRPEYVLFDQNGDGVNAEIIEVVYLGELSQFTLKLPNGLTLTARQITDRQWDVGAMVKFSWNPGYARVVID